MAVADLTISQLADRTGVAVGTLRMWESRHGFPSPQRRPSGHRRYREQDVELIRRVVRERDAGLSLAAAIERASAAEREAEESIFAGLRRRRPELDPRPIAKRALIQVSRAIEDEYAVAADRGVLIGAFQREVFYRAAEPRWRELARRSELALVLAEFGSSRNRQGLPVEVPIAERDELSREWALVCDAPGFAACLVGRERPDPVERDGDRVFEVLWSAERYVVREAARIGAGLAVRSLPKVAGRIPERVDEHVGEPDPTDVRRAVALTNRMVGYLTA